MPQDRPPIPAEMERQVFFEAGHRCAVCGEVAPLELAHIIPWSRTKEHSVDNLICLCAGCHGRADREKWDSKVLQRYKKEPWVLRTRFEESANRPTTLSPLHQLPPPPADFTGRKTDLAELRAAVESGGVTISSVRGMGGIGKTALALKIADELAPRYPDAQIYLDLQGVSAQPVTPAQAMAHVIRAFHPDTRLPDSESEIAALYRSALHDRRALLLMDNASGADQVRPLIPPTSCLLLVTSRSLFHLPGLHVKDLDEMPKEEACDLLLHVAPRIGDQAGRIAEICAGVPFALRQAAGTLAERPDLSPATYASRLASGKIRLGLIDGSLSLSYDLLPEEMACCWRTLSVFPATFDAPAAAAVWNLRPEPAETALGDLVRRSLVEGDDGRYRLHDLAKLFADSRCDQEERRGARRRHALHYREVLAQADSLFLQRGSAQLSGLQLVNTNWANIQAGQSWGADHISEDDIAAELAVQYPNAGANCLNLRLQPREWISWCQTELKAARFLEDSRGQSDALYHLGQVYLELGEAHTSIEMFEQQLAATREAGDRRGEGDALNGLGTSYAYLGEASRAIEFQEKHLAIACEVGDSRRESIALIKLGYSHAALGNNQRAMDLYEKTCAIAHGMANPAYKATTLYELGMAYGAQGENRRAIIFCEQALCIARDLEERRGQMYILNSLGLFHANLSETDRAIKLYQECIDLAREIGHRFAEAGACWNLGIELAKLGKPTKALELMQARVNYEREGGYSQAKDRSDQVDSLRARLMSDRRHQVCDLGH